MKTYTGEDVQRLANKAAKVASNTTYQAARMLLVRAKRTTNSDVSRALRKVIAALDAMPAIEGVQLNGL